MKGRHFAQVAWTVAGAVAAIGAGADAAGFRVNTTASVPVGVWRIVARGESLERGEIVTVCPPDTPLFRQARAEGYIPRGRCPGGYEPLFKPVAAVPSDVVTVGPNGIRVNGEPVPNTAPLTRDGAGRALPVLPPGRYEVAPSEVWLLSSYHARSFDSRYFGPVPAAHLEGVLRPWLIGGAP